MGENIYKEFEDFEKFISTLDSSNMPTFRDTLYKKLDHIAELFEKSPNQEELRERFFKLCNTFDCSLLHKRAREKPLGYAGDFLIIDWIYTKKTATTEKGKLYDLLFQSYEGAEAVRNRKQYFIDKCLELSRNKKSRVDILNLGCGPCRDVLETFEATDNGANLHFHCIDNEPKAIEYAQKLLNHMEEQKNIKLDHANVLRFRTSRKYDLIWVAGLFDYLEDRMAVILLKKIWRHLKDNGQIIFGNFSPANPALKGMGIMLKWNLFHRNANDLINLCRKAKLPFTAIESEPLGVNLFCIIRK